MNNCVFILYLCNDARTQDVLNVVYTVLIVFVVENLLRGIFMFMDDVKVLRSKYLKDNKSEKKISRDRTKGYLLCK